MIKMGACKSRRLLRITYGGPPGPAWGLGGGPDLDSTENRAECIRSEGIVPGRRNQRSFCEYTQPMRDNATL